jgi:hypothetical protein
MSPPRYRLVVEGELGPRYASAFDGMTVRAHHGETDITGPIIDEAHLRGLLDRIANLGLTLHSLTPVDRESAEADAQLHERPTGDRPPNSGITSKGT